MANNKKFEFNLDFLLNLKMDNAMVERLVGEINKIMKKVDPNLDFNSDDFKKSVDAVVKALDEAENGVVDIEKLLSAMEMDIDFNNADSVLDEMVKTLSQMEQVDLDNLQNSIKQLENIDVNSQFNELENALKNVDLGSIADEMDKLNSDDNFVKSVEKLADGVNKAEDELKDYIKTNKTAMQGMKDSGQEGSEAYKKMEDEIKSAEEALNKMNDTAKDLGSSGSFIENMFKFEAIGQAADQLKQLSESGIEFRDTLLNVGGQIGLSADELEKFKDRALDAFGNGIGGSVAEATKALGTAQQMLGNFLDEKQLMDFTKGAAAIGQVFDKDINEVIGGSRTFISTFGLEGQQAFELVGLAMQKSGSKMDDTLDTLDEYSGLLKRAGYEGAESVGLISKAMELGARDTDKLADSIKETNIRLMEGEASKELTDAIAMYGNEMPSALAKTLQSIIKAGEEGKKTTKEVMQESSSAILTSFDDNQINDVLRDKLARTISGTMAEDMGGEMWTKIFSAKIDASSVEAQAKTAGEQIANALGPVTVMEKFQRQIEGLWTEASLNIAPYTSQLATGLSSVASVAPAIQLMKDTNFDWLKDGAKNALSFGTTLLQKLVPSLFIQTAATEAGAVAQTKFNFAVLANPYVLAAAGLAALVGGLIYYVSWLDKAEERKLDSIKSEQELANKQIESNKAQQDKISRNQDLIKSYEDLGSKANRTAIEEEKFRQTTLELGKVYPEIIGKSNDFNSTLSELKNVANNGKNELTKLQEEANKLQLDKKKLQFELEKQEVTIGLKEIGDLIEEETETWFSMDTGSTAKINKDILEPYKKALKNAKNDKEIADATYEFQKAITTLPNDELSPEAKSKIVGQATSMADAQKEALKAKEEVMKEAVSQSLDEAFKNGTISDDTVKQISEETGSSMDDVARMLKDRQEDILVSGLNMIDKGKDANQVYGEIAKTLGKSPEEVKKLIEAQKGSIKQAEKQVQMTELLAQKWGETSQKANKDYQDSLAAEMKLLQDKKDAVKSGNKELAAEKDKEIKLQEKTTKQALKIYKDSKATEETINKKYESKTEDNRLNIAKSIASSKNNELEASLKAFELTQKYAILDEERERNSYDDLLLSKEKLNVEEKKLRIYLDALKEKGLIQENQDGTIEITTSVKADKQAIEDELRNMKASIDDSKFSVVDLQARVKIELKEFRETSEKELNEAIFNLKLEQLQFKADTTGSAESLQDIEELYKQSYDDILLKSEENKKALLELEKKHKSEIGKVVVNDAVVFELEKQITALKLAGIGLEKDTIESKKRVTEATIKTAERETAIFEKEFNKRKETTEKYYSKAIEDQKKYIGIITKATEETDTRRKDKTVKQLEESKQSELDVVERYAENMSFSADYSEQKKLEIEKKYQDKQEKLEKEFKLKKEIREKLLKAAELKLARDQATSLLKLENEQLKNSMQILEKRAIGIDKNGRPLFDNEADEESYAQWSEKFSQNLTDMEEKHSLMGTIYGAMSDTAIEGISKAFEGDWESAGESLKEGIRSVFAILVGELKAFASATVTKAILEWLGWGGDAIPLIAKIALVPVMEATTSLAIDALLNPVIGKLTSFASGGMVDSPTLAVIGDGAKLGSQNKEWIFRNDQLQATLQMAVARQSMGMDSRLLEIRDALNSMKLETVFKGRDFRLSYQRDVFATNKRAR